MTIQDYTRRGISIETLPLKILMGLDIRTVEEEKQVQELVNARRRFAPVAQPVNLKNDKTDFKTIEEEKAFQAVIDGRVSKLRPQMKAEETAQGDLTEENNPEHSPVIETPESVDETPLENSTIEELSAQESTLKEKIKKLKMQAKKLKEKNKLA